MTQDRRDTVAPSPQQPTQDARQFARNALADDPGELDEDWLTDLLTRFAAQRVTAPVSGDAGERADAIVDEFTATFYTPPTFNDKALRLRIAAALTAATDKARREALTWQLIETAPKDYTRLLTWQPSEASPQEAILQWDAERRRWIDDHGRLVRHRTNTLATPP